MVPVEMGQLMKLRQLLMGMLLGMVLQDLGGLHSRAAHDGELICSLSPALLLFLSGQFGDWIDGSQGFGGSFVQRKKEEGGGGRGKKTTAWATKRGSSFAVDGLRIGHCSRISVQTR
jgi:hypothetical protein